jgi:ribosomal protein S18 acetylase RimI-like enzyme
MIFKTATPSDTDPITSLVNSAYRGESSKLGWTTEADLLGGQRTDPDKILEILHDKNSLIEMAVEGIEIVGLVHLKKERGFLYFGMLTVKPTLQNMGIGKKLLSRIEEIALGWGYTKIRMTVIHLRIELIQYYERRGYHRTGETEPFPAHDPRFGIPKTDLVFHVFQKTLSEIP